MHNALIVALARIPVHPNKLHIVLGDLLWRLVPHTPMLPKAQQHLHDIVRVIIRVHTLRARVQHDALVVEVEIGVDVQRVLIAVVIVLVVVDGIEVLDCVEAVEEAEVVAVADLLDGVLVAFDDAGFGGCVVLEFAAVEAHVLVAVFALVLLVWELVLSVRWWEMALRELTYVPEANDVAELMRNGINPIGARILVLRLQIKAATMAILIVVEVLEDEAGDRPSLNARGLI